MRVGSSPTARTSCAMTDTHDNQSLTSKDRIYGCMVGGAVGDALGYAIEFEHWPSIERKYGPKGITRYELGPKGKALISDDTQMALYTANGVLLGMTRGYLRGIMARPDTYCIHSYLDWLASQDALPADCKVHRASWLKHVPELHARRAPGNTYLTALASVARKQPVNNNSCGCGGVMRTAPIALICAEHCYADGSILKADLVAAEAARITHKHPLGFIPSAILNHILMLMMYCQEEPQPRLEHFVEEALKAVPEILSEEDHGKPYKELWPQHLDTQRELIEKALELAGTDIPDHNAIEQIGGGWTGHEALAIAVYSAVKHQESFEDAIVCSVNHSGDSDSTGAVCGNIMGCFLGRNAIPANFTRDLELLDVIEEISEDIYTGCIISDHDFNMTPEKIRWEKKYVEMSWEPPICIFNDF